MSLYKDVTAHAITGNAPGNVMQTNSGALVRGCSVSGTSGIYRSTNNGQTWSLRTTYSTATWLTRLKFVDSRGYLYMGTIDQATPGKIFRSADDGVTWTAVATSEGSGWWYMCEDAAGNLYANEYSTGLKDANELYAYNVWKSADLGVTWSIFYTAPKQSTPGAKDGIRHIHHISVDPYNRLVTGFGDPTFALPATEAFQLSAAGVLGVLIPDSTGANGFISRAITTTSIFLLGGDASPNKIYKYNSDTNILTDLINLATAFPVSVAGPGVDTGVFDLVRGKDGVIYGLSNGITGVAGSLVFASPDDGVTWRLLKYQDRLDGASFLALNRNITNSRLYIGLREVAGVSYISLPDYTRGEIAARRVIIR